MPADSDDVMIKPKTPQSSPLAAARYLGKFCHLLILSIILTVPIIYPLKLSQTLIQRIVPWFESHGARAKFLWDWELEPILYFGLSPLLLKWVVAEAFILVLCGAYILWKLLTPSARFSIHSSFPSIIAFGLLIYAGVSTIFVSPTIHTSLMAYVTLVLTFMFFIIIMDIKKTERLVIKSFILIGVVATLLCIIAIMQHLRLTDGFLLRFDRIRNSMGSLIGHNTGLSSYLMTSYFLSITALTLVRNRTMRLFLIIFLVMEGFVIVAAQSRAVIAILFFLTPLYFLYLRKISGLTIHSRWFVTAGLFLAAIVLAQMVNKPWNPFYFRDAPLVSRLQALNPKNLRGTRLRILTASRSLLGDSPLYGYGFASFQYIYPKAQAEYYASHPDTILIPTDLRSQQAHNEYLETAINLGFGGLFFILLALYLFLRRGQDTLEEVRIIWQRRLLCAIFFSITAYLLHSFVDFPMQIPPLSLMFFFLLGIWASSDKIWLRERADAISCVIPASVMMRTIWGRIALISIVLLMLIFFPLANAVLLRPFRSDLIYFKSDMYTQTFHQYPNLPSSERLYLLNNAIATAHMGTRLDPLNCEMQFKLGEAFYLMGAYSEEQARAAEKAGNKTEAERWKLGVRQNLIRAVRCLETALREYRFHAVYYLLGICEEMLDRVEPGKGHLSRARENYAIAVRYSPAYAPALKDYSELLLRIARNLPERERIPFINEIVRLRKLIAKYQPEFFQNSYVEKAYDAMAQEEYERAIPMFIDLVQVQPENIDFQIQLATVLSTAGKFAEAKKILDAAALHYPDNPSVLDGFVMYYIYKKDYEKALPYIQKRLQHKGTNNNVFEVFEALTLETLGKKEEAKIRLEALEKKSVGNPMYLQILGMMYIDYFNNEAKGIAYLEQRARRSAPTNSKVYYRLAVYTLKKSDKAAAISYLEQALKHPPDFKKAKELYKQLTGSEGKKTDG